MAGGNIMGGNFGFDCIDESYGNRRWLNPGDTGVSNPGIVTDGIADRSAGGREQGL